MTKPDRRRRTILGTALAVTSMLAVGATAAQPIPQGDLTVELEPVATGLTAPVVVTGAGDGSGRLFIVEQSGQIRVVENGVLLPTPFLDISAELPVLNGFFDERGLLGVAFHPDHETNGRFFVRHSVPRAGTPADPCLGTSRGCHSEVLVEYVVSAGDPNVADPASRRVLFSIDEPQFNHNAGDVAFGPDGYLYFSLGDGGGANDGLADVPPSHGPIGNGQNIETALGSMLRIDVDAGLPYGIPADNPFVGSAGLDEIYAYGMRNPYRFSFDDGPGGDGRLLLADVGQNLFEEVNVVEKGGNYGWVVREGFHCFDPFNPLGPPDECGDTGPLGEPLRDPLVEYSHPNSGFFPEGGITVIGGYVYRGSRSPLLDGTYLFGDFAQQFFLPSGNLYYLTENDMGDAGIRRLRIGPDDRPYGRFLKGFGEGDDGEVYVCGSQALAPFGESGIVERIVAVDNPGFDIRPGGCSNPLNPRSRGVLPAAIVGTETFDVSTIDVSSIRLRRAGPELAFVANLDGGQAAAGQGTGSPATGHAFMTLDLETNVFTMDLEFSTLLGDQTVQHVHGPAPPGVNAGVLFGIPGPGSFEDFSTVLTDEQIQVILEGRAYINVHSTFAPGGEIRGQVLPAEVAPIRVARQDVATPELGDVCSCNDAGADGIDDLTLKFDTQRVVATLGLDGAVGQVALAVAGNRRPSTSDGTTIFRFPLEGGQQVPAANSGGTGSCTVTVNALTGGVSVGCSYSGLNADATVSHIHGPAAPGENAGVILPLTVAGGTSGLVTGGGTLGPLEIQQILDGQTYVNVHSTAFPPGEIRGQIAGGGPFDATDCVRVLSTGARLLPAHKELDRAAPEPQTPGPRKTVRH
jgi:glucose/arabinose dehydrogenase